MKKTIFVLAITCLLLTVSSCTRTDVADPPWDGPAGFNILLEGSVKPALQIIDGYIHTSTITVKVTDAKGNPLANATVFLEQLADSSSQTQLNWGYFTDNKSTYQKGTDANGEIHVTFFWPVTYYSNEMWIHAMLMIDGRAYRDVNVPQDYISLAMYRSGGAAAK